MRGDGKGETGKGRADEGREEMWVWVWVYFWDPLICCLSPRHVRWTPRSTASLSL